MSSERLLIVEVRFRQQALLEWLPLRNSLHILLHIGRLIFIQQIGYNHKRSNDSRSYSPLALLMHCVLLKTSKELDKPCVLNKSSPEPLIILGI